MRLEGIHHITAITGDAPRNVEFYAGTLGLRMVKKTVNQDDPTVYHLFYADEKGSPGSDITFFEYPGLSRGRAGAGMVYRIVWRVASTDALDFWAGRLKEDGIETSRGDDYLRFEDPEGLELELRVNQTSEPPLRANHPEVPVEHALLGFDGVRAYTSDRDASAGFLSEGLGFEESSRGHWVARGEQRESYYVYDEPPSGRAFNGAGTVHHVAWASTIEEHAAWRERVAAAGAQVTPGIDRFYFKSIYFREPSGVLFEIATMGPGFTADEPLETLGEGLSLPPDFEHLRDRLTNVLTPLPNPRAGSLKS
ncbi:MAG: VOC family protein [Actinomycetota bacterium]|nr:VOC family protein [Actinomycetota bacterium]